MVKNEQKLSIKEMNVADRPREKLLAGDRRDLTDAELLAILIGSGNAEENAVELSKRILGHYGHNLHQAGTAKVGDLRKFGGIGITKAVTIIAALELGRRRGKTEVPEECKISCSKDLFHYIHPVFADLNHEEFWVVTLNTANIVKGKFMVSKGGVAGTVADPRVIFGTALERNAACLILVHNHPSGNLKPSQEDLEITKKLVASGKLLNMQILDHLIITNKGYLSLADEGFM